METCYEAVWMQECLAFVLLVCEGDLLQIGKKHLIPLLWKWMLCTEN